ncbi:MAG: adenylyl-sulfate kinase [Candidatus Hodarchaeota archaeon]
MKIRKIRIKILGSQGIIYRIFIIICNAIFFAVGAKQAMQKYGPIGTSLIWNSINMCLYFLYHCIFSKLFSLEIQTKKFVLWFTGLPCSGKTTLADEVSRVLKKKGIKLERLDGDIVRKGGLSDDLGFSEEDRNKNLRRVTFVSNLLSKNNVAVLASFVSPYRNVRKYIRDNTTNFIEVYMNCSKEECVKRDVKGMWKKAINGEIKGFTGHDSPYEIPIKPEIIIDSDKISINKSVDIIIKYLIKRNLI